MNYLYSPHWELHPGPPALCSITSPSRPLVIFSVLRLSISTLLASFL